MRPCSFEIRFMSFSGVAHHTDTARKSYQRTPSLPLPRTRPTNENTSFSNSQPRHNIDTTLAAAAADSTDPSRTLTHARPSPVITVAMSPLRVCDICYSVCCTGLHRASGLHALFSGLVACLFLSCLLSSLHSLISDGRDTVAVRFASRASFAASVHHSIATERISPPGFVFRKEFQMFSSTIKPQNPVFR